MMRLTHNSRVAASRILALGVLLAALMASLMLAAGEARASTTFTVTNTDDSGAGSLRQAMLDANNTAGADIINFDIPGTGVHTIVPATALPQIIDPVTINGYTQPGASPNTLAVGSDAVLKIELSGQSAGSGSAGLQLGAANSTIKGLVVNRWGQMGISVGGSGATGNEVVGNYIGTDASGTKDLGNTYDGVVIYSAPDNTIGGTTAAGRNVISANNGNGVYINGSGATGNEVVGNYIGTDASGTKDLGNSKEGVLNLNSPNTIGGTTAAGRNVISANDGDGVFIGGASNSPGGNEVTGNYVGTDATGTQDLGNSGEGVYVYDVPNNTIGGTTAAGRNVISANDFKGVYIAGSGATGNKITGNYVGTDASGAQGLGNYEQGIAIHYASNNTVGGTTAGERNVVSANGSSGIAIEGDTATSNKVVGNYVGTDATGTKGVGNVNYGVVISLATNNTIGGTVAGSRNVISANSRHGVYIVGDTTGNRIISNSIFANAGLGINLDFDGPTPNDTGDADTGPNGLQNFPVLSSAKTSATSTTLQGTLNSAPSKTFRLQFFSNPAGADEGKTLIGETSVTTDAGGNASFEYATSAPAGVGQGITATATDSVAGNTSEFSAPVSVVAAPNTSPTITLLKPTPGSTTRDRTPTIGAKVTDAETNLAKSNIRLYVDGNKRDFSYDRSTDRLSFTPGTRLSFGKHTVKVVATDASATASTKSWSFKVVR